MRDQTVRCRESQREQPSHAEKPPTGQFQSIVAYHRGFCALAIDGKVVCWRNIDSTFNDGIKFNGKYKSIATDNLQVCAIDLDGALWCARPASDKISKDRIDSPAVRLAEGPYHAVASSTGVCALAENHVDCLWPTYPFSHQPRKAGEYEVPNTKYIQRLEGTYSQALRTAQSTCGLGLNGQVTCVHASRYPNSPKTFQFSGEFTQLTSQRGICAKRKDNSWQCEDKVELPGQALSAIRVFMNMNSDRVAGLTPAGDFVGENVPSNLRGGFETIYGDVGACAVRKDDTVFCEWPIYDDDAFHNVTSIQASESEWMTDKGKFSLSTDPRFRFMTVHGRIDPRNADVTGFAEVQHGADFGCGLKKDGELKCWLTTKWNKERARVPVKKFKSFALGQIFGCGITPEDDVRCWGNDYFGAVSNQPAGKFQEIRTTRLNACAVRADQTIICWGQAFPEPFELPFKSEKWAMTGEGVCGVDHTRTVQCFGQGYAWTGQKETTL